MTITLVAIRIPADSPPPPLLNPEVVVLPILDK
jgi:hypothetical protein